MNYRRHYFLLNISWIIGMVIGFLVWFVESSVRMFSAGVAKMPFESISWRMYVYPLIGGALVWLLIRFPLMASCEKCRTKLRFYRMGTPRYICPHCRAQFAMGGAIVAEPQTPAEQPATVKRGVWADLRRWLYPQSEGNTATWKVALVVLGIMALLSAVAPVKGLEVEVMGIQLKEALASRVAWIVWAIVNLYLLIGIIWNLADPEDAYTASLPRQRRGLFMALGIFLAVISLLAPLCQVP